MMKKEQNTGNSVLDASKFGPRQGWRTFFDVRAKIVKINFTKLIPCHYFTQNKNILLHEFIVIKQISMRLSLLH